MNVEQLLDDALHARTADVRPDPTARDRIADQLAVAAPTTTHPHRRLAVFATAAAVVTVAGVAVGTQAWSGHDHDAPAPAGSSAPYIGYLPGHPLPPTRYFVGLQGHRPNGPVHDAVVRASDGKVVATLPDIAGRAPEEPQLAPDGRRAYAVWGNGTRLGYIDLTTGRHVTLVHRKGGVASPTVSADGTTLAYQWTPELDGDGAGSIVIRTLSSGRERVLPHAPAGPQEIPLALSPDGSKLALVATDRSSRPLWIVRTDRADAFAAPTTIAQANCGSGSADEPRWTAAGLYAVRHCLRGEGRGGGTDVVAIDPGTHRVGRVVPPAGSRVLFVTVLAGRSAPTFVTSDESAGASAAVTVLTGNGTAHGYRGLAVHGLAGLAVSGAE